MPKIESKKKPEKGALSEYQKMVARIAGEIFKDRYNQNERLAPCDQMDTEEVVVGSCTEAAMIVDRVLEMTRPK